MTEADWKLLCLFLSGEADSEQTKMVQQWREASPENRAIFDDARRIMQPRTAVTPAFDSKRAFKKLEKKLK